MLSWNSRPSSASHHSRTGLFTKRPVEQTYMSISNTTLLTETLLILTRTTLNYVIVCILHTVQAKLTHIHALLFSKLQVETVHNILRGLSRPMLGRSCSLTPSSQPFPDPSVLSAPPPVTSSSSCYPVR